MSYSYRRATVADYTEVIGLVDNFLDGLDYLPATYRHWCHDSNYHLYVAETQGRLVRLYIYRNNTISIPYQFV